MIYLTTEQQDRFYNFLKSDLKVSYKRYAKVMSIAYETVWWQRKNNKVPKDQAIKFLKIYLEDFNMKFKEDTKFLTTTTKNND